MKQRVILIVVVAVIVIAGFFVLLKPGKKDEPPKTTTFKVVDITNAEDFSDWIGDDLTTVEKTLYDRVKSYETLPLGVYHGTIRAETFKTTYTSYQESSPAVDVPTVKYIVDIPEAKQSYFVSRSGGEDYPYNILYVVCVPKEQMIYADFGCRDEF
jgi:hypothetical protein